MSWPCPDKPVQERLQGALQTRQPFTEREVEMLRPDGQAIRVNCTVLPVHQTEASCELLMELHQVDRQIRITREEHLLSQHQATQALLRGLAHEIKNPSVDFGGQHSCSSANCRTGGFGNTPESSSTRPIGCRCC